MRPLRPPGELRASILFTTSYAAVVEEGVIGRL
jgi:hypothetical protein